MRSTQRHNEMAMQAALAAINRHAGAASHVWRFDADGNRVNAAGERISSLGSDSHAERDFDAEALPASPGPDHALAASLASLDGVKFHGGAR